MAMTQEHSPGIEVWLGLIATNGVGPTTFAKLIKHFGSPDAVLGASARQLAAVEGIGPAKAEKIAVGRGDFDAETELALAEKLGVLIINIQDSRYPAPLKGIYDPPPVLYIRGSLARDDNLAIAIVGSRRCGIYGREQAARLGHLLAAAGITVVSGMARGIDTAAHQGALSAHGRTIAVQGCGLSQIYPPENKKLFERIGQTGACISELPLAAGPKPENFPPRNRIIAGLSLGTIVVEAQLRSGAMITARVAMENEREVMAVPGRVDSPFSAGPHSLLKQGARLVEGVDDVTEALGFIGSQLKNHVSQSAESARCRVEAPLVEMPALKLTEHEKKVLECLGPEPTHADHLSLVSGVPAGAVNASLVSLQLKTMVKQLPGNMYKRR